MSRIGTISTSSNGEDVDVKWRMYCFFSLSEKDGTYYCSPNFSFGGEKWCLVIWPNGFSEDNSSGHIDLRLFKYSSDSSIRQKFSFSIKTPKGEKENEKHCKKIFDRLSYYHQFNRFMSRSELLRRRSELVLHDVLTIVCTMKNTTSAGRASNTSSDSESDHDSVECFPTVSDSKADPASESAECCHCKVVFNAESLFSHQRKCMHRPIKCPDCLDVVVLQKWLEEHECQEKGSEDDGSLCQDFKKVLLEGINHDLILKAGDKELRAHRDVLRARSQVLKSILDHDMKEKNSGIIDIPDCDPLAMEQFLSYIYSGEVEILDQSNMLNLYYVADKYDVKRLKKGCSDFIRKSLSQTNICDVIQLALNHSDSSLLENATEYFMNNTLGIMRTVEWQVFMKDNPTVANEILIKSFEKLNNVKS